MSCKRSGECGLANIKGCWRKRSSDTSNDGVLDSGLSAQSAGCLEGGLGVMDQVVALRHVFGNAETIDKTVNELLVWDRLAKVVQLSANPVQVV